MKTSLSYHPVNMGTKKARENVSSYRAVYAALHSLLDAYVIKDGRVEREFTQVEMHRWCSTAGLDMNSVPVVARWFRDLMAHITHAIRFQLDLMEKAKGSAITSLEAVDRFTGELNGLGIRSFHPYGAIPLALFGQARHLSDDEHKCFMLKGDRKGVTSVFHFENENVYMQGLISTILLMELHRNCGSPISKNRGEDHLSWFGRVEEFMGVATVKRCKDKPSKLPRKASKSW